MAEMDAACREFAEGPECPVPPRFMAAIVPLLLRGSKDRRSRSNTPAAGVQRKKGS
jgi:hypothetical protein